MAGMLALSELLAVAALRLLPRFSLQLLAFSLLDGGSEAAHLTPHSA